MKILNFLIAILWVLSGIYTCAPGVSDIRTTEANSVYGSIFLYTTIYIVVRGLYKILK